jgi:hypothetical protein
MVPTGGVLHGTGEAGSKVSLENWEKLETLTTLLALDPVICPVEVNVFVAVT